VAQIVQHPQANVRSWVQSPGPQNQQKRKTIKEKKIEPEANYNVAKQILLEISISPRIGNIFLCICIA
jgi:hypothetical protein